MVRGINTRTTRRRHTSRRSICRPRCVVRAFTSRDRSGSRRRLRSGWPGGRSCVANRRRSREGGERGFNGDRGNAMRKLTVAAVAAAAVLAAGVGCSTLGRAAFEQPVVHLRDVKVRGLGLTGGSLDVLLSVYNPNHYRLDATRLTYKVALAGDSVTLATGALDSRFSVQDRDSTTVTIPASFTYSGIGAAGKSILGTGAVDYHVSGDVTVASTVGNFTVPYSQTGRFTTTGVAR